MCPFAGFGGSATLPSELQRLGPNALVLPTRRACENYVVPDPRVGSSDVGEDPGEPSGAKSESNGRCTVAGLRSVESAVYVLMDQSASMDKFFGEKDLRLRHEATRRSRRPPRVWGVRSSLDTCYSRAPPRSFHRRRGTCR